MILSIVVSAYSFNRLKDLIEVIDAIQNQSYKPFELNLIIDKDERLFNAVKEHISINKFENTNVIFNKENNGLSYSRNVGVLNSTGKIIAFIDDDAIPDINWAKNIVETFHNDSEVGAIAGEIIPLWEHKNMCWFPKELHWMISCSYVMTPCEIQDVDRGFGANMAFLKELIVKAGMFDTNLGINGNRWIGGEDTKMFLSVKEYGKRVVFNPYAIVHHKIYSSRIEFRNIAKRSFNGGLSVSVLKNYIDYNPKKSTENSYLKQLLFEFYPKSFMKLLMVPTINTIKQISAVSCVIFCEIVGYSYGKVTLKLNKYNFYNLKTRILRQ